MRIARWLVILCSVATALPAAEGAPPPPAGLAILVLGGGDRTHEYSENASFLMDALKADGSVEVAIYTEELGTLEAETLAPFDAILIYARHNTSTGASLTPEQRRALAGFVRGGGALLVAHYGLGCFDDWPEYGAMIGARWREGVSGRLPYTAVEVTPHLPRHDAVGSVGTFRLIDAPLVDLIDQPDVRTSKPLMFVTWRDVTLPASWTVEYGRGRVFVTILGHGRDSWQAGGFQRLMRGGLLWAARR